VKSFGAEAVFDYRSQTCADDIRAYTKNSLYYAIDCITGPTTMELCYNAIGRAGGKYTALDPYQESRVTRTRIKADWVLGPALLGKKIAWPAPFDWEGNLKLRAWAEKWFDMLQKTLDKGKIKPHPIQLIDGGLSGIMEGLQALHKGVVSGKKLVYCIP